MRPNILYLFSLLLFFSSCSSCSNDDEKIQELEAKINQQQEDINKQQQQQLKDEIASKEKEIESLKNRKNAVKPRENFFARGAGRFPEASERLLNYDDVGHLSSRDLKIMRNEIFARHGYIFKTNDMNEYFSRQSWYEPVNNDVTGLLSRIETENVNYIKSYE
ncbi:MAG: hypothetical protein RL365_1842 [Bacteroidota bacterium]|jgi:small-conductance mechanosensitive channel